MHKIVAVVESSVECMDFNYLCLYAPHPSNGTDNECVGTWEMADQTSISNFTCVEFFIPQNSNYAKQLPKLMHFIAYIRPLQ